MVSEEFV